LALVDYLRVLFKFSKDGKATKRPIQVEWAINPHDGTFDKSRILVNGIQLNVHKDIRAGCARILLDMVNILIELAHGFDLKDLQTLANLLLSTDY
jgi:hypothetical protein